MVLDLRGHGLSMPSDLASVTLEDYVADIASVAPQIEAARGQAPILGGWQTGALLAMMYAASGAATPGLLLFSPLLPLEAGGKAPIEVVRSYAGEVLSPQAFGIPTADSDRAAEGMDGLDRDEVDELLARTSGEQESGIAFRQALRGVSISADAFSLPVLSVQGENERAVGDALAHHFKAEAAFVPGGSWGIVRHEQTVIDATAIVDAWLTKNFDEA